MLNDGFSKNALAPLVLRVALAVIFIYHGLGKVIGEGKDWGANWAVNAWRDRNKPPREAQEKLERREAALEDEEKKDRTRNAKAELEAAYNLEAKEDLPPDSLRYHWAQLAVAWGEVLGGFALLFGLLTRVAAVGLLIIQAGAILTVTAARGFSFVRGGGYEYNLALIAMCLTVLLVGGGPFAVDNVVFKRSGTPGTPGSMPAVS